MTKKQSQSVDGFSPQLIGEVVVVQVFERKNGEIKPNSLQKTVGVLKAYYGSASEGGSFIIDGYPPRLFTVDRNRLEIFVLKEVV
jgi:hypothetical protein